MASKDSIDRILFQMVDPITNIRNGARAAEEHLADGAPPAEVKKDLALIRAAAAQLNHLLNEARVIKQ